MIKLLLLFGVMGISGCLRDTGRADFKEWCIKNGGAINVIEESEDPRYSYEQHCIEIQCMKDKPNTCDWN